MIRKLQFFIPTKNLIKMFKAPTLPPTKKSPAITRHLICHLKGMKTRTLVFGRCRWIKTQNFFLKTCFLPSIYWTVSTLVLVYKQKQPFADVLQNGCFWIAKFARKHQWRGLFFYETALLLFAVCKFIKKETLAQLSSYEFCEIFKKTFLIEHRCFYVKLVIDFESQ